MNSVIEHQADNPDMLMNPLLSYEMKLWICDEIDRIAAKKLKQMRAAIAHADQRKAHSHVMDTVNYPKVCQEDHINEFGSLDVSNIHNKEIK